MKNHRNENSRKTRKFNVLIKCSEKSSMPNVSETTSDRWSKLPDDLLRLVVDRISNEKDFIGLRSVCSHWRSAIPLSSWRSPWLLAKRYETPVVVLKGLSGPSNSNMTSLFQTELCWRYWGSFTGWILGQHPSDHRLKLINPLAKTVIDLPPLHHFITKGLVYHNPGSDSRNLIIGVMAISHSFTGIAMIDKEYKNWTFLTDKIDIYQSKFTDLVWYKDNVAAVRADGTIVFFNESGVVRSLNPQPRIIKEYSEPYLVESSGDLLIVARSFMVYRINIDTGDWIQVTDLGRHALFIGNSYSISHWISEYKTCNSWRPNCIYNATYASTSDRQLSCYNIINKRLEFHDLDPVTEFNKCYDCIWYMPALGSQLGVPKLHK